MLHFKRTPMGKTISAANIKMICVGRYRCIVCKKDFKGKEYVAKHIFRRHHDLFVGVVPIPSRAVPAAPLTTSAAHSEPVEIQEAQEGKDDHEDKEKQEAGAEPAGPETMLMMGNALMKAMPEKAFV